MHDERRVGADDAAEFQKGQEVVHRADGAPQVSGVNNGARDLPVQHAAGARDQFRVEQRAVQMRDGVDRVALGAAEFQLGYDMKDFYHLGNFFTL